MHAKCSSYNNLFIYFWGECGVHTRQRNATLGSYFDSRIPRKYIHTHYTLLAELRDFICCCCGFAAAASIVPCLWSCGVTSVRRNSEQHTATTTTQKLHLRKMKERQQQQQQQPFRMRNFLRGKFFVVWRDAPRSNRSHSLVCALLHTFVPFHFSFTVLLCAFFFPCACVLFGAHVKSQQWLLWIFFYFHSLRLLVGFGIVWMGKICSVSSNSEFAAVFLFSVSAGVRRLVANLMIDHRLLRGRRLPSLSHHFSCKLPLCAARTFSLCVYARVRALRVCARDVNQHISVHYMEQRSHQIREDK